MTNELKKAVGTVCSQQFRDAEAARAAPRIAAKRAELFRLQQALKQTPLELHHDDPNELILMLESEIAIRTIRMSLAGNDGSPMN